MINQTALMTEVVRTFASAPRPNLLRVLDEHRPDTGGRCPACRSIGCTIFFAACQASRTRTR